METQRIGQLDGLRGLASLIVLVHHVLLAGSVIMCQAFIGDYRNGAASLLNETPLKIVWAGHEAVQVFFVLSGFVLALPFAQGRGFDALAYYPSRLLRLWLPAVGALLVAAALHGALSWKGGGTWWLSPHGFPMSWHAFGREVTLLQNNDATAFPFFTAIWSLKWEVWFSLALPLVLWAVARGRVLRIAIVAGCLGLVSHVDQSNLTTYLPLFPLGTAAAYELPAFAALARRAGRMWILGFVASAALLTAPSWLAATGVTTLVIQALAAVGLVVTAATGAADGLLQATPVRWLGSRSFSLYLVHESLIVSVAFTLGATGPLATFMLVAIPVALLGAELFYRGVERPAHQLARRVGRRSTRPAPAAPVAA